MEFILWLTDRDGGEAGSYRFETEQDLFDAFPYAEHVEGNDYTAWVGGRA